MSEDDLVRRDGNCFEVAAEIASGIHGYTQIPTDNVFIVHAVVVPIFGPLQGQKFAHAFAEDMYPSDDHRGYVYDFSNGAKCVLPIDSYYEIGGVEERYVWRYTIKEARRIMCDEGHVGPWNRELLEMIHNGDVL